MTIIIPGDAVLRLREAAYWQLGSIAERLHDLTSRPECEQNGHWLREPVTDFDRARALLDEIGWSNHAPGRDVEIDLDQHRPVIVAALTDQLAVERDLMSEPQGDAGQQHKDASARALVIESFAENAGLQLDTQHVETPPEDDTPHPPTETDPADRKGCAGCLTGVPLTPGGYCLECERVELQSAMYATEELTFTLEGTIRSALRSVSPGDVFECVHRAINDTDCDAASHAQLLAETRANRAARTRRGAGA
jgi:hypothetical protein